MLQHLRIRNLALLDEVELEFDSGFIAVTGETGAGKSILLGALSLLSGSRADKSVIRQGADQCEVEGIIHFKDRAPLDAKLVELDLPVCEDGALILSRTLDHKRAAKIRINGQLTTLNNLQELGEWWIDFHGPGEPQKLFHEHWQRQLIDLFAKNRTALETYQSSFHQWRATLSEIHQLESAEQLSPDERDFLQTQIQKIDSIELTEEAITQLEHDFTRLSNAQEITELANEVSESLGGDSGVTQQISQLVQAARDLSHLDPSLQSLSDRLESTLIEMEDLASEYAAASQSLELDPEDAQALQERMEQWLSLKRKYGGSVEAIRMRRDEMFARLSSQGDIEGSLKKLRTRADKEKKDAESLAETLRESRVRAAHSLSKAAAELINKLGFKKAKLQIEIVRENDLREHGNCRCEFLFSPNAGQPPLPLDKVASSGEIARVMLALKAVLAQVDATPVLVFDEVDANVGGEIATVVGGELARLGKQGHQVFCITHLPQVASMAPSHWVVRKEQDDQQTRIEISTLHQDTEARIAELARMLGSRNSSSAISHAKELLATR